MDRLKAQEAVYKYSESILKVSFAYVKNTSDAEDIAQDVFLALFLSDKEFESEEHLKAWLIRTAINKSKNHLKRAWNSKRTEFPAQTAATAPEDTEVLSAVLSLEEKYRIPLHLFYYEGYSIKEIAGLLHKKPSTVGSCLARGREKLKKILEGESLG